MSEKYKNIKSPNQLVPTKMEESLLKKMVSNRNWSYTWIEYTVILY
jgi:hypothetical protein